jgi:tetratricopeptide (TPR) repeat protein
MNTDQQGNSLPGASAASATLYDQAVESFNIYRGDPLATIDQAIALAPDLTMAHLFKSWVHALATEPEATRMASAEIEEIKRMRMSERETSHLKVLELLVAGQWTAAAIALDQHNIRYPYDMLALQAGHLIDFYRANARNLRDRIARVLPQWSVDIPGYPILLGMYAFGLEENGNFGLAEETGRLALDLQPLDCWAHHAVTHVMEMQGRVQDGIGWMIAREPHWSGDDNFFKVHNWWHRALFHLDLGQTDEVMALYDGAVRQSRSSVALDLIDAAALLWRLELCGIDVGNRWQELAQAWEQHADGRTYAFNDWHAIMALLGAGRTPDAEQLLAKLQESDSSVDENSGWNQRYAVPLAKGFMAFHKGDFQTAADSLHGARFIVNGFGGSHAQRDIIDWTLTEAAARGGLTDLLRAQANERLAMKPHSPVNRQFLQRSGSTKTSNLALYPQSTNR